MKNVTKIFEAMQRIAIIALIAIIGFAMAGCDMGGSSDVGGGGGSSSGLDIGFLGNFSANIQGAGALGIARRQSGGAGRSIGRNIMRSEFETDEYVNYLVMYEEYEHGVEWDESGITNVTFTRRTVANDGEEDYLTQEQIPAQVNRLYVFRTFTFIQFIPADTSEMDPSLVRPQWLGDPDPDGYYAFDKSGYFNDENHKSFIIDNSTGYIYPLGEDYFTFQIDSIHNGLLKIHGDGFHYNLIYDYKINASGDLEIFPLFTNEHLGVYDYFKDKYGNNFLYNQVLNEVNTATNTIFINVGGNVTDPVYLVAENTGDVIRTNGDIRPAISGYDGNIPLYAAKATTFEVIGNNLQTRAITADDYFEFGKTDYWYGSLPGSFIKNKEFFYWSHFGGNNPGTAEATLFIMDTDDLRIKHNVHFAGGGYPHEEIWAYVTYIPRWKDNEEFVLLWDGDFNNGNLSYFRFDRTALAETSQRMYFVPEGYYYLDPELAPPPEVYPEVVNYRPYSGVVSLRTNIRPVKYPGFDGMASGSWAVITTSGTTEYTVALEQTAPGVRTPTMVTVFDFQGGEGSSVILKPINRPE